jgi:hypothetical protein
MIPRIRYFFARGDWKFLASAVALAATFAAVARFVHV